MDRLARGCAGASAVAAVTVLPRTARVRGGGASTVTAAAASTLVDRFFLPLFMVGVCMNAHKTIVNNPYLGIRNIGTGTGIAVMWIWTRIV